MEFSLVLAFKYLLAVSLFSGNPLSQAPSLHPLTDPPTGQYIDFSGDIGGTTLVQASLYLFSDGTVKGGYFYDWRGQEDQVRKPFYRMNLAGTFKEGKIDLQETDLGGRHLGQFVGQFGTDEGAEWSLTGVHHDLFGGKDQNFYLSGDIQEAGCDYNERYAISGTQLHDHEVEYFAHRVQTTVLQRNSESFMTMVEFPLLLQSASGKSKKIKNEAQLRERFPDIFNPDAHQLLLNAPHYMMPVDEDGIVLGEVLHLRPNKRKGLSVYKITQK